MLTRFFAPKGLLLASARCLSAEAAQTTVSKDSLMKLRKRTGYSYVNCRKALVKFGEGNMDEAEKWLRELAAKEGWAKAAKLSSRETKQGLVGVATNGQVAAVVELSCETDFVARGDNFKGLLENIATSVLSKASSEAKASNGTLSVTDYDVESVNVAGKSLKELVSMSVGKLGENITVKTIKAFVAPPNTQIFGHSHPKEGNSAVEMGRFVSLVALQRDEKPGLFPSDKLAYQLCQHIIGMRPEKLGEVPGEQKAAVQTKKVENVEEEDELNAFDKVQTTEIDEEETGLLRQSFMLNPSQTVHSYVTSHSAALVDFARFELTN